MVMMHVSWPVFKQHEPYRKDYQFTTVREVKSTGLQCVDDRSDLPSNYFPVPIQMLRNDLVVQVTHRSLFRLDTHVSSHRSCKTLSKDGVQKRVPQQYGNDHPQLINSLTLRQPKEAAKVTLATRSRPAAQRDKERRPPGVGTARSSSAPVVCKSSAPTRDRPTTINAPWAKFVSSTNASTKPESKAMPRAASAARDRAQSTPAPPARPVRPAADAMVHYLSKPKAPPCPVAVAAALQAVVNVNQRHSSQAVEVDRNDRVPVKEPPIPFHQMPTSFYKPIPPPIKEPPMPKPPAMKPSFLEQVADQRDLNKIKPRAFAQGQSSKYMMMRVEHRGWKLKQGGRGNKYVRTVQKKNVHTTRAKYS